MTTQPSIAVCKFKILVGIIAVFLSWQIPDRVIRAQEDASSARMTPLVQAVAKVRPSVVNLRGKKTVPPDSSSTSQSHAVRQVNGMGTGVIIDPSGYILTNYHVVEGVKRIQVTLHDGSTTTGKLIAHDDLTDLALLKIRTVGDLPVIPLGSSSGVMLAETVAALGNAYGYEDTVTRGIVSEIGRTVQVSDRQVYHNLIQTDASINPGNSGGPLINLDGEMIGINVAVRVGAQGIAFAIPVNDAMEVAANFLANIVAETVQHGITAKTIHADQETMVQIDAVAHFSAAQDAGLRSGDVIKTVDGLPCPRSIDLYRQLLRRQAGDEVALEIDRHGQTRTIKLKLSKAHDRRNNAIWTQLGVHVSPTEKNQLRDVHPNYSRGLRIEQVRSGSPADKEGMQIGDVLVAMHGWKTETIENLLYILQQADVRQGSDCIFYIIRKNEPFYGHVRMQGR